MIPKTIHYCWFSGDKKPRSIQRCIDSWKKIMPDYKIRCWDGSSIVLDSIPFVREAMSVGQYAAASDYVRLYALYSEGGIYLDSDVETFKSFDCFLENSFFSGTETFYAEGNKHFRIEAAIMGSIPNHPFLKECMSYYEHNHFIKPNGEYDNKKVVMPIVISRYAEKYGYKYLNIKQNLTDNITVYPTDFFTNTLDKTTININSIYALHRNAAGWMDFSGRGLLFQFCRKNDLMNIYHWLEKIRK